MPARRWLTREIVVAEAAALIDANPDQALTLARVAERLRVRTPSLYNHLDGLDDLNQAIALYGVRELGEYIGKAAIAKSGADALVAIADAYRAFAREHPGVYRRTQRAPEPDDHELQAAAADVVGILQLVLGPYGLTEDEQIHTIRGLRSLLHGFVSLELGGGFGLPVDLDESFARMVQLYVAHLEKNRAENPQRVG
jgi:AcrR family transcriptional regulator